MSGAFELVKARVTLEAALTAAGAKFTGGHWNPAPCCGHADCLSVFAGGEAFKCHSCGAGGSVIDLAMAIHKIDEASALKRLAAEYGVEIEDTDKSVRATKQSKPNQIRAASADYYHRKFMEKNNSGWDYFGGEYGTKTDHVPKCRGHREETARRLKVGWADGKLLEHLLGLGFKQAEIVNVGLYVAADKEQKALEKPHDYWKWGFVVFPVIDENGAVIAFTGKMAKPHDRGDGKLFKGKVSAGEKKYFLNHSALFRFDELFLVEGENDVASLIDAGFENVIGTAGGFSTVEQGRLLKNHLKGKKLLIWFDRDEGGGKLTKLVVQALKGSDVEVRVIPQPGPHKDADDFIQLAMSTKKEGTAV